MPKPHTGVVVLSLPNCDFCKGEGKENKAEYDGKTTFGYWAFMCFNHYEQYGIGLGLGRGQKLLTRIKRR